MKNIVTHSHQLTCKKDRKQVTIEGNREKPTNPEKNTVKDKKQILQKHIKGKAKDQNVPNIK